MHAASRQRLPLEFRSDDDVCAAKYAEFLRGEGFGYRLPFANL